MTDARVAPEILTASEAAALLRCDPDHVARLCKAKKLPGRNLGGRLGWRIHRDDVLAYVRGRRAPAAVSTRRPAK